MTRVMLGGRYGVLFEMDRSGYSKLKGDGLIGFFGIGASSGLFGGGITVKAGVSTEAGEKIRSRITSFKAFSVGGVFNSDQDVWAQSLKKNSGPIQIKVEPITTFISSKWLPK